jgi:hypothetical protein
MIGVSSSVFFVLLCTLHCARTSSVECLDSILNQTCACFETFTLKSGEVQATVYFSSIDGSNRPAAHVEPNHHTLLRLGGTVTRNSFNCATCSTQLYLISEGLVFRCISFGL